MILVCGMSAAVTLVIMSQDCDRTTSDVRATDQSPQATQHVNYCVQVSITVLRCLRAAWHAEVGHHHIQTQNSLAEENTERECRHLDDKVEVVELADVSVGDRARLRVGGRLEQP